jgi:hypothetical protein
MDLDWKNEQRCKYQNEIGNISGQQNNGGLVQDG